jgi:pyruvate ferredoxin oxidoreductase alpha subunit
MLKQIEGSRAIAATVALCRPDVICAYPITPQTHIVEALAEMTMAGQLGRAAFVNVESEFAAMSVAIGASAAGARAYTATSSQGLLCMAEALYNASGLGLPIVMTLATRALGAPINIWNDHSDAMAMRDAGFVQLFASSNQEAADLHILAFRLAEEIGVPVMVCVDGFLLTHAVDQVDIPSQALVDALLPPFRPAERLEPERPITMGALVGPQSFMEVKALAHEARLAALARIPTLSAAFAEQLGRPVGGLVRPYRTEGARTIAVALGVLNGSIEDVVDAMRADGFAVGALDLGTFRPFPAQAVAEALRGAERVVVFDKNLAVGMGSVLADDVRLALGREAPRVSGVVAGLGGRPITQAGIRRMLEAAHTGALGELTLLDLDRPTLERERRSA